MPRTWRTIFSASMRWYIHATLPVSVTCPLCTAAWMPAGVELQPDLDVVGHSANSANPLGDALCRQLLRVTVDESGQGDGAVVGRDADRAGVDLGLPLQGAKHRVSDSHIVLGQDGSCHDFL